MTIKLATDPNMSIKFRVIYESPYFLIQIANSLPGGQLRWQTVAKPDEEKLVRIPMSYVASVKPQNHGPDLLRVECVEVHSVPMTFSSYADAFQYVYDSLGLNQENIWVVDSEEDSSALSRFLGRIRGIFSLSRK